MSELIWLTVPHQTHPVAVWYENKEKLMDGLNEHEIREDLKYTIEDYDELIYEASMQYRGTLVIDKEEYQELRANKFEKFGDSSTDAGRHQKQKVIRQIVSCAEELDWNEIVWSKSPMGKEYFPSFEYSSFPRWDEYRFVCDFKTMKCHVFHKEDRWIIDIVMSSAGGRHYFEDTWGNLPDELSDSDWEKLDGALDEYVRREAIKEMKQHERT